MKAKLISENKTEVQFSNKKEGSTYTYFQFNGDIQTTMENLGLR